MFLRSFSKANSRFIWFDLETTGFNPFNHNIIEIAAVDNYGNIFNELISIGGSKLPKKITEITHITEEMLIGKPDIRTTLEKFKAYLDLEPDKQKFIIGHNSYGFDMPFIKCKFRQNGIKFPSKIRELDTMRMAQLLLPHEWSHSLGHLCDVFGIQNKNAHRALSDVYATQLIYNHLCIIYKAKFKKISPNLIINKIKF